MLLQTGYVVPLIRKPAEGKEDFEFFTDLLWKAFSTMRTRVPMTDWYYTDTSEMVGFRHRTVQGGLFIKLMLD